MGFVWLLLLWLFIISRYSQSAINLHCMRYKNLHVATQNACMYSVCVCISCSVDRSYRRDITFYSYDSWTRKKYIAFTWFYIHFFMFLLFFFVAACVCVCVCIIIFTSAAPHQCYFMLLSTLIIYIDTVAMAFIFQYCTGDMHRASIKRLDDYTHHTNQNNNKKQHVPRRMNQKKWPCKRNSHI